MIEVELKFQPTEKQYKSLLAGAKECGQKINHDIYYDYSDFRLLKKGWKLRNRNGIFELKVENGHDSNLEIENEEEIEKFLGIEENLKEFIEKLIPVMDYVTERKKYKKEEFIIDVDEVNANREIFCNMCEIELMVEKNDKAQEARDKIIKFAERFGLKAKENFSKKAEFLKKFNPEKYREIYENVKNDKIKLH